MQPTITIFTPTYNRAHTLGRTYQSLCNQTCKDFEWLIIDDGSTDDTAQLAKSWAKGQKISIRYIYKENGGLYTGYNTAYANIDSELCVCIDSDDYMPNDAVEKIIRCWRERGSSKYAGLMGLDYHLDNTPIGGYFPTELKEVWFMDLYIQKLHIGDTKPVLRTELLKEVAPMEGFPGEKNFNPVYMMMKVCDKYPLLLLNENLCYVDYQTGSDSMSAGIWKQYMNSPRSFQKQRILEMQLKHNTWRNRLRVAIHYVASSIIAHDRHWLRHSPLKFLTLCAMPFGVALYLLIRYKTK